jgi:hypothetical protein
VLLRLERNYDEAIRLLQPRLAEFHFDSEEDKGEEQVDLAWIQRLAGDTAGAKATAEQSRNKKETMITKVFRLGRAESLFPLLPSVKIFCL